MLEYPLSSASVFQGFDHSRVEQLAQLTLPRKIVFLDVDGTIVGQHHVDALDAALLERFRYLCSRLRSLDWSIGLNSDTPLPYLKQIAGKIGLDADAPIIAEHGAIFARGDFEIQLHHLADTTGWMDEIRKIALSEGFRNEVSEGIFSVVYGGTSPKELAQSGRWGFGAKRSQSLSMFAPSALIEQVANRLDRLALMSHDLYLHSNPADCFLALHKQSVPGMSAEANKAKALALLERAIRSQGGVPDLVMVGDGPADFVDNSLLGTSIRSILVPGGRGVPADVRQRIAFIPQSRLLEGVNEGLEFILSAGPVRT